MIDCSFELNGKSMSIFNCHAMSLPAFSGRGIHVNHREFACHASVGPILPGTYYILDRESGGVLGPIWDRIYRRTDWFALYAIDDRIDDLMFCNEVERGNFRLHPKRGTGISKGCVVIDKLGDYQRLRAFLQSTRPTPIPGSKLSAYGRLIVK